MANPVIERLIGIEGCPVVTAENVDEFLALDGMVVLFFTGDPRQRPESNDVAVVLREMSSVFPGQIRVGIVDQAAEEVLKSRFGVLVVPTLVYLRRGKFVGLIPRIQDWQVYIEKTRGFLAAA
jgi:hydrogenase-1 operon protein HyaE